jgi:DNA-binding response OmpR family regulator
VTVTPACLLLDLNAGGISDNLKMLDTIRSHRDPAISGLRVVLATAQVNNQMFSWQAGVDGFLVHPFHADELLREVAEVLDRPDNDRVAHRRDKLQEARAAGRTIEPRVWDTRKF